MLSSAQLRDIVAQARQIIERQLDDAELIAGFREVVAENGGDWSALKALIKAQVQDERDEVGDGKRVKRLLSKAEFATAYADMLGLANMNEDNFSAEEFDAETGEILDHEPLPPDPAAQEDGDDAVADGSSFGRTEPSADGQPIRAGSHVATDHGDEGPDAADDSGSEPGSVASASGDNSAAKASRFVDDKPLRPYCLHPGPFCGGYGRNHCGACQRAASNATVPA